MDDDVNTYLPFPVRQAVPHWRIYGVLTQTNRELPLSDGRRFGGGLVSTVPEMAQFMIAQLNQGQVNGSSLLQPQTLALMQRKTITVPQGMGDINQGAYGLGLAHLNPQPWQYWGHFFGRHGALGHGGSTGSSSVQMWYVPKGDSGYGILFFTNVERLKPDYFDVWFFATNYRIQTLLMDAAADYYQSMSS